VIGSPTSSRTPQPRGDLGGRAGDPLHAANVQEGFVDRQPFDRRGHVFEDGVHRLARIGVRGETRRHDDRAGAEAPRAPPAHRRLDPTGLRLVAGGEHDAAPDDDGLSAETRIVPLLDGRVERVQIGVENRGLGHEHMFAHD
jgi:hypothetical protein